MEGSLSVLCWHGESSIGFVKVQKLWVVLDVQWSSSVARCSYICEDIAVEGACMVWWVMYDGDLICVSHSLRHVCGESAMRFTDLLRRESMVVLCQHALHQQVLHLRWGSQMTRWLWNANVRFVTFRNVWSVVLHCGLRHSSNEWCMMFMRKHGLISMQGVW